MMQKKLKEKFKYPMLNSLSSFYSIANEINLPNYMLRGQPLSPYERNCKIQLAKHINGKIFLVHSANHFCFSIWTIIPLFVLSFYLYQKVKIICVRFNFKGHVRCDMAFCNQKWKKWLFTCRDGLRALHRITHENSHPVTENRLTF